MIHQNRVPTGFGILELFWNFIYPFQGPGKFMKYFAVAKGFGKVLDLKRCSIRLRFLIIIQFRHTDRKALLKVIGVLVHAMHACVCNGYIFFFNMRVNWSVTSAHAVVSRTYKYCSY